MATFELQGIEYEWKWCATDVAHAMAIAGLTQRVHGRTDPNADEDHDFTSLIGGRWVAVNQILKAKDLTNNEAVHLALALQTILLKVAEGSWIVAPAPIKLLRKLPHWVANGAQMASLFLMAPIRSEQYHPSVR